MTEQNKKDKGVWAYFILTYALMLLTWGLMAIFQIPGASAASSATAPAPGPLLLLFLGGFSPSIAGVLMTWRVGGRAGLRDLWKRTTQFNLGWKWYLVILLLPLLILGLRVGVQLARGGTLVESRLFTQPLNLISFTIPIILIGPISEEFGWRGFALDRLLTKCPLPIANLILGVVWAFWHLPLFFIPGTIQQLHGNPIIEFPVFAVQVMGLTVLFSWLYISVGRSLFAAILFHVVYNWIISFSGTIMDGGIVDRSVNAVALAIIAAIILMWWRPSRHQTMA